MKKAVPGFALAALVLAAAAPAQRPRPAADSVAALRAEVRQLRAEVQALRRQMAQEQARRLSESLGRARERAERERREEGHPRPRLLR